MCGILGVVKAKGQYVTKEEFEDFKILLRESEARGRHATGIMYVCDNEVLVKKAPAQASDLLPYIRYIPRIRAVIGHTRHSTGGSPLYNENNHPIESPNWALVHNGMVSSEKTEKELGCISQCDTELFVRMFEHVEKQSSALARSEIIKSSLEQLSGSWALCFVNKKTMEIFFTRNTNPCSVFTYEGGFYFASSSSYIRDTNRVKANGEKAEIVDLPVRKIFSITDAAGFDEVGVYSEAPSKYGRNYDWCNHSDYYVGRGGNRRQAELYNSNNYAVVTLADIDMMFLKETIRIYKVTLSTNIDPRRMFTKELECYAINMLIEEPELFDISKHYIAHLKGMLKQAMSATKAGSVKPRKSIMKKVNAEFSAVVAHEAAKDIYRNQSVDMLIDEAGIISANLFCSLSWWERIIIAKYGAIIDTTMLEREAIEPKRRIIATTSSPSNEAMFTCSECKVYARKEGKKVMKTETEESIRTVTHYSCPFCHTVFEETGTVYKRDPGTLVESRRINAIEVV